MITELFTDDFGIYTVRKRKITDDTSLYKSQRDRQKLRNFLKALLRENEVVIFYIDEDDGLEKFVVATTRLVNDELFDLPVVIETFRDEKYEAVHCVGFVSVPDNTPYYINVDDITRFLLKNDKILEISSNTRLF